MPVPLVPVTGPDVVMKRPPTPVFSATIPSVAPVIVELFASLKSKRPAEDKLNALPPVALVSIPNPGAVVTVKGPGGVREMVKSGPGTLLQHRYRYKYLEDRYKLQQKHGGNNPTTN